MMALTSDHKCNFCVFHCFLPLSEDPALRRCDRILWYGKGLRQLEYKCTESQLSDHRPVSSTFMAEVEVANCGKLERA
jgi:hypothetical protein